MEGIKAVAKLEKKEESRDLQCFAVFVLDYEENLFFLWFRLNNVGESLLRGYGAYQVEIMCSVPGNLAFLPSFHFNRLESISLIILHLQAFLYILLLLTVMLNLIVGNPIGNSNINTLHTYYGIKIVHIFIIIYIYFVFEEILAFKLKCSIC